jgi:septation ring formation regulator EzrA
MHRLSPDAILDMLAADEETILKAYQIQGQDESHQRVLAARISAMRQGAQAIRGQTQEQAQAA